MTSKYFERARSSVTGKFVTLAWAVTHPKRTIVSRIKRKDAA